jgi:hypothetical protein
VRPASQVIADWSNELASHLGRSREDILAKGLSAYDFSPAKFIEVRFPDQSFARFKYAFAVISEHKKAVAVFTEHCGYLEFALMPEMAVVETTEEWLHPNE